MLHCTLITLIYPAPTFLLLMLIWTMERRRESGLGEVGEDRDTIVDELWWMQEQAVLLGGLPLMLLNTISEKKRKKKYATVTNYGGKCCLTDLFYFQVLEHSAKNT